MTPLFEPTQIQYGGHAARGVKIVCNKCGGHMSTRLNTMAHGNDEQEQRIASRRFTNAGWDVGSAPSSHRCPNCTNRHHHRSPFAKLDELKNGTALSAPNGMGITTIEAPPSAEQPVAKAPPANDNAAPRVMGKDDGRLIYDKLNDVYVSERTGYTDGWTDNRVATDLGVPIEWVAKVRGEWFGPAHSAEHAERMAAAHKLIEACVAVLAEVRMLDEKVRQMQGLLERTRASLAAMEREAAA